MSNHVTIKDAVKRYGDLTALNGVSLDINEGEFFTLLGPSGCGKTTLLRMIAGFNSIESGEFYFGDKLINNIPAHKRDIGMVFQNYAIFPHLTVKENVAYGLKARKVPKDQMDAKVKEALELVQISHLADRKPNELSGGQQQRVALARAFVIEPSVLLMDEPLSNLDAKLRSEMRIELKRLHKDLKSTFVYVTHDQLEAMTLASKVCLMKDGLLQQFDPPLKTYTSPCNLFVADFVGNPTMNFVKASFFRRDGSRIFISLLGHECEFVANEPMAEVPPSLIVGIRPEYIEISDIGKLEGIAYSTLPSGMETTIKVKIGDAIVSSVVFGAIDFPPDQPVRCSIIGSSIILFDESTGFRAASGSLKL